MSNKHLRLAAHVGRDSFWWWHERPRGITIYYGPPGQFVRFHSITWSALRKALARKDRREGK